MAVPLGAISDPQGARSARLQLLSSCSTANLICPIWRSRLQTSARRRIQPLPCGFLVRFSLPWTTVCSTCGKSAATNSRRSSPVPVGRREPLILKGVILRCPCRNVWNCWACNLQLFKSSRQGYFNILIYREKAIDGVAVSGLPSWAASRWPKWPHRRTADSMAYDPLCSR